MSKKIRSGNFPKAFLDGFSGIIQYDGYSGYNKVEDVILAVCSAHCRRKFYEALPAERQKQLKLLNINSETEVKDVPLPGMEQIIPCSMHPLRAQKQVRLFTA